MAAAIQRERMRFSALIAGVSRNIGLSSSSLNPGNPVHPRPPNASAPGWIHRTAGCSKRVFPILVLQFRAAIVLLIFYTTS